ncbi:MAG: D-alanyl-D-alanine carboxypeptidase family protein [Tissierellia bacterium]|nr:D-alanyl-D-alanine carboxypeptidase family protein [Tissierellia bacterium]
MKRIVPLIMAILLLIPQSSMAAIGIEKSVHAYYVGEQESGQEFLNHNGDEVLPIASITKIMTYMIVKDAIQAGTIGEMDPVTITEDVEQTPGSSMELKNEEIVTVQELIRGLIIVSANDAAVALAKHVAGTEQNFIPLMEQKAEELGLRNYHFYNASGYPFDGVDNLLSAKDVFKMTKYCLDNYPEILTIAQEPALDMPARNYRKDTTIPLVGEMKGVDGLKTGTTDAAGHCLVSTFTVFDDEGNDAFRGISVVLGTESKDMRNKVARYIIEYVQKNFRYREILDPNIPYKKWAENSVKNGYIEVYPEEELVLLINKETGIIRRDYLDENKKAPIKKGEILGELTIEPVGLPIHQINLVTKENYELADTKTRLQRLSSYIFEIFRTMLYI